MAVGETRDVDPTVFLGCVRKRCCYESETHQLGGGGTLRVFGQI